MACFLPTGGRSWPKRPSDGQLIIYLRRSCWSTFRGFPFAISQAAGFSGGVGRGSNFTAPVSRARLIISGITSLISVRAARVYGRHALLIGSSPCGPRTLAIKLSSPGSRDPSAERPHHQSRVRRAAQDTGGGTDTAHGSGIQDTRQSPAAPITGRPPARGRPWKASQHRPRSTANPTRTSIIQAC